MKTILGVPLKEKEVDTEEIRAKFEQSFQYEIKDIEAKYPDYNVFYSERDYALQSKRQELLKNYINGYYHIHELNGELLYDFYFADSGEIFLTDGNGNEVYSVKPCSSFDGLKHMFSKSESFSFTLKKDKTPVGKMKIQYDFLKTGNGKELSKKRTLTSDFNNLCADIREEKKDSVYERTAVDNADVPFLKSIYISHEWKNIFLVHKSFDTAYGLFAALCFMRGDILAQV